MTGGDTMNIRIWLVTRERHTWITGTEVLALALVLLAVPGTILRLLGFVLLARLGYKALTSLPLGMIPGRPLGTKAHRRNQDLRSRVVVFLSVVRNVEEYAQRIRLSGIPTVETDKNLRSAQQRVMSAAADVAKSMGRINVEDPDPQPSKLSIRAASRGKAAVVSGGAAESELLP